MNRESKIILMGIALIFSLVPFLQAGTTGLLKGEVIDQKSRQPLAGVNVVIIGTNFGAATDQAGKFVVYHVPAGVYQVKATMMGYQPCIIENVRIIMDLKTEVRIEMIESVVALGQEVVVTAERPLISKDITGTTHSVGSSKMNELPVDSYKDIVALQPGVTSDLHIRGGRVTEVLYLVDGLPIQQSMEGGAGSEIPQASVAEMTVQTGGFGAEYGNAMSGIINIVTKSGGASREIWTRFVDDHIGIEESNKRSEWELMLSGPIYYDKIGYFLSSNIVVSDTRWWQDLRRYFDSPMEKNINLLAKLNFNLTHDIRLITQAIFSDWGSRPYEYRWRYNLAGLPPQSKRSLRLSATFVHTLSPYSFYSLNFSRFQLQHKLGQGDKSDVEAMQPFQYELPWYYFVFSGNRLWWQDATEISYLAKGDFTTQYHRIAQFKMGFEMQYFDLENDLVKYEPQKSFWGKPLLDRELLNFSSYYHYRPYQGAFFIQNKVDNDIVVMNLGLRYEFLNPRAQRPVVEWIPITAEDYKQEIKGWAPASIKSQLSPRFGFSFPITKNDFFFINYGFFFQVPMFDYMFTGLNFDLKKGIKALYGNPDLKPERTRALELSYKRTLGDAWLVSFTYFNKEISGLIDTKTFLASDSKAEDDGYTQFVNLAGGRASGFELLLEKKYAHYVSGKISYSHMSAKGLSGSIDQGLNYFVWGFAVPNEEFYLSWDQRQTLVGDVFIGIPNQLGLNLLWRWHSPRPYTYYPSRTGYVPDLNIEMKPNNARMRTVSYVDVKLFKNWLLGKNLSLQTYVDVRNLLDKFNVLWIASDGRIGGELGDPGAYDIGRRVHLGVVLNWRK
ncbi:MAG: TonB-dependent receptor [candidate division KSB1 bacterium]|nr:TonB-dependent receptor [candidate division KSB1 bacterium]